MILEDINFETLKHIVHGRRCEIGATTQTIRITSIMAVVELKFANDGIRLLISFQIWANDQKDFHSIGSTMMEIMNLQIADGQQQVNSKETNKYIKYLRLVDEIANLSKDPSTKVGSIILGPSFEVRSLGYNGAPRGCVADEDERNQRPEKLFWFSHAELNAITNAARVGTPLAGCALLVTHPPCMDCARAIVQAGIAFVVARNPGAEFLERWEEHTRRTKQLFEECNVEYVMV